MDINSPAAWALRALQKQDQVLPLVLGSASAEIQWRSIVARRYVTAAQTALGELLGLECTGALEESGDHDHSGETCPIHEWLVDADYLETVKLEEDAAKL